MASDSEIRQWLRDQGEQVSAKGPLSNARRLRYAAAHGDASVRLLPGPGELDDLPPEAFGPTIDVDIDSVEPASTRADPGPGSIGAGPGSDEPPKHAGREWRQSGPRRRGSKTAPKITVGLHNDIAAKISLMLEVPGQVWAVRDPVCGGTFVQQRPDIAAALTDIVCESADLVAFFTGPAGGFMRWLNLAVACYPVASVVMAHHVYHTIEGGEVAAPDLQQYAA